MSNGSVFLCSVYYRMALSSLNGLAFTLQLASGESMCKQIYNTNYFQTLLYMEPFQATWSYCVSLQNLLKGKSRLLSSKV